MNKSSFTIFLVIASLLLLTACNNTKSTTSTSGFIGGTDGLVASFVENEPPAKVFDANTNPFRISLMLENKGEYNVQPSQVLTTIDSIDYSAFQISNPNQKNPSRIAGTTRDTSGKALAGDKTTDISYEASYKNPVPAPQPFTIGMNICYQYQTQSITKTCLRKDVTSRPSPRDVCKIEDARLVSGSGAPIQVTSISERPSGRNQIALVVEVTNKGPGEVYDPSFLNKGTCVTDPSPTVQNRVKAKIYFPDGAPSIKCTQFNNGNEGTLRLVQETQRFDCIVDTTNLQTTTFEKAVTIQLDYVYKDYISQQVIVDKSL